MSWGNENWNQYNWYNTGGSNPSGPAANRLTPGQAEQRALLGKDLFFQGDYSTTPHGDYTLLQGIPALRQAVIHRLITNPGEFKTRPSYGVGVKQFVKQRKTATNIALLKRKIEEQLVADARVEEVLDIIVESIENGLKLTIRIRASGKALELSPITFNEFGDLASEV